MDIIYRETINKDRDIIYAVLITFTSRAIATQIAGSVYIDHESIVDCSADDRSIHDSFRDV